MENPPLVLFHPSYVVEYAIVGVTIKYIENKTINVDGKWLGKVPKLAICFDYQEEIYHLAHCDEEWNCLAAVVMRDSIDDIKKQAEKYYKGINDCWVKTNYQVEDAQKENEAFEKEKEKRRCSFCHRSPYEENVGSVILSESACICSQCIKELYEREYSDH